MIFRAINDAIDVYNGARNQIFAHVGYVEDWRVIPLDDSREMFWRIVGSDGSGGQVEYAKTEHELENEEGDFYVDDIYTQRHLPKWVYRGPEFTMICCDPHTDGNTFLRVFANSLERP